MRTPHLSYLVGDSDRKRPAGASPERSYLGKHTTVWSARTAHASSPMSMDRNSPDGTATSFPYSLQQARVRSVLIPHQNQSEVCPHLRSEKDENVPEGADRS